MLSPSSKAFVFTSLPLRFYDVMFHCFVLIPLKSIVDLSFLLEDSSLRAWFAIRLFMLSSSYTFPPMYVLCRISTICICTLLSHLCSFVIYLLLFTKSNTFFVRILFFVSNASLTLIPDTSSATSSNIVQWFWTVLRQYFHTSATSPPPKKNLFLYPLSIWCLGLEPCFLNISTFPHVFNSFSLTTSASSLSL